MSREYLTTSDIARNLQVTRATVLRWIRKGYLPAFILPGGHYRIRIDNFNSFVKKYDITTKKMIRKTRGEK